MATIQVVYFNVRAKAEAIRMILSYGNVAYSDKTCQEYFGAGWGEVKADETKVPLFGQLPLLVVDDKGELCQSGSQVRYVATLTGLMPADAFEAARCDAIFETGQDIGYLRMSNPIVNVFTGDTFAEHKKAYFELIPSKVKALNKSLGNEQFFGGAKPMYCDVGVYCSIDHIRSLQWEGLNAYPNILKWMARIEGLNGIKEYLCNRPDMCDIGVKPLLVPTADTSSVQTNPRSVLEDNEEIVNIDYTTR